MLRTTAYVVMLMLIGTVTAGATLPARIQDGSADVCWDPDVEFPVPCDEDE